MRVPADAVISGCYYYLIGRENISRVRVESHTDFDRIMSKNKKKIIIHLTALLRRDDTPRGSRGASESRLTRTALYPRDGAVSLFGVGSS